MGPSERGSFMWLRLQPGLEMDTVFVPFRSKYFYWNVSQWIRMKSSRWNFTKNAPVFVVNGSETKPRFFDKCRVKKRRSNKWLNWYEFYWANNLPEETETSFWWRKHQSQKSKSITSHVKDIQRNRNSVSHCSTLKTDTTFITLKLQINAEVATIYT